MKTVKQPVDRGKLGRLRAVRAAGKGEILKMPPQAKKNIEGNLVKRKIAKEAKIGAELKKLKEKKKAPNK